MKLAVYEPGGVRRILLDTWKERFSDRCTVVTSGIEWVDFIPFGTNKARGLLEYQKRLGIRPEECMAFGDEYNDIEMLKSVPWGFAMAHSKQGVKRCGSLHSRTCRADFREPDPCKRKYRGGCKYVYKRKC